MPRRSNAFVDAARACTRNAVLYSYRVRVHKLLLACASLTTGLCTIKAPSKVRKNQKRLDPGSLQAFACRVQPRLHQNSSMQRSNSETQTKVPDVHFLLGIHIWPVQPRQLIHLLLLSAGTRTNQLAYLHHPCRPRSLVEK